MRFTADQAQDSKCLSDLVVSGCTVGKTVHLSVSFILEMKTETLERVSMECPETENKRFHCGLVLRHSFEPKASF